MDERRCDVMSMVEASDCRGGVAVSMCSLEAVAAETESLISLSHTIDDIASSYCSSWYTDVYVHGLSVFVCVCVLTSASVVRDVRWGLAGTPRGGWRCSAVVKSLQSLLEAGCVQLWLWARVLTLKKKKRLATQNTLSQLILSKLKSDCTEVNITGPIYSNQIKELMKFDFERQQWTIKTLYVL